MYCKLVERISFRVPEWIIFHHSTDSLVLVVRSRRWNCVWVYLATRNDQCWNFYPYFPGIYQDFFTFNTSALCSCPRLVSELVSVNKLPYLFAKIAYFRVFSDVSNGRAQKKTWRLCCNVQYRLRFQLRLFSKHIWFCRCYDFFKRNITCLHYDFNWSKTLMYCVQLSLKTLSMDDMGLSHKGILEMKSRKKSSFEPTFCSSKTLRDWKSRFLFIVIWVLGNLSIEPSWSRNSSAGFLLPLKVAVIRVVISFSSLRINLACAFILAWNYL